MKEKRVLGIFLIIIVLSLIFLTSAQDPSIEKAYSCLKQKVGTDCTNKKTETSAFTLSALSYDSSYLNSCKKDLMTKQKISGNFVCWGDEKSSPCDLKDTALSILSLNHISEDTSKAENWLKSKKKISTDLDWYLEIDTDKESSCSIKVNNGVAQNFILGSDKKIKLSGDLDSCLSPAIDNYFLQIGRSDSSKSSCYFNNYTISCNETFLTTMLYRIPGEDVFYLSSKTNSAPGDDKITEKINSFCFSDDSNKCDYEGSLWAAFALAKTGNYIGNILPYLNSKRTEMTIYFPSAFLYILTNEDEFLVDILSSQKRIQNKYFYWQQSESSKKYYDTALALLSLGTLTNSQEAENSKAYLLSLIKDEKESGCWNNNAKDTAFLLFSGWPKSSSVVDSCSDEGGYLCSNDEICNGDIVPSSDNGVCCDQLCDAKSSCESNCSKDNGDYECGLDDCNINCGNCTELYDSSYWCNNHVCINDTSKCVNECNTIGIKRCRDDNNLEVCGNYNNDSCLEWGNITSCTNGCSEDSCISLTSGSCSDYCIGLGECPEESLVDASCDSWDKECCLVQPSVETCSDKGGIICQDDEECSVPEIPSSDTESCCVGGECNEISGTTNDCEDHGYFCQEDSCSKDQEVKDFDCGSSTKVCCEDISSGSSGGANWFLIILLIILIILVVLAIIFRDQLKVWLFKMKSKFKSGGVNTPSSRRPPMPPGGIPPQRPMFKPRTIIPRSSGPSQRPPMPRKPEISDPAFDETMKKLKEMTK